MPLVVLIGSDRQWMVSDDPRLPAQPAEDYPNHHAAARSGHAGGVNAAFGDGHVDFVNDEINTELWRNLGAIADGFVVELP